jgi:excisionase family DNA binding protein
MTLYDLYEAHRRKVEALQQALQEEERAYALAQTELLQTMMEQQAPKAVSSEDAMNTREAAQFLGVKESTLRAWVSKNTVPFYKIGGSVRFGREELRKFRSGNWKSEVEEMLESYKKRKHA